MDKPKIQSTQAGGRYVKSEDLLKSDAATRQRKCVIQLGAKEVDVLRARIEELEKRIEELNHRHEVDAHLIRGFASDVDRAKKHVNRLENAIRKGPHEMGCHSLQKPNTPGWASLELCDCWKRKTLEGE